MAKDRWKHSSKSIHNINYHLIWCPKYRRRILEGEIRDRLRFLLQEKSIELGIKIKTMEIMSDHVHLFISARPIDSPHYIIQQFKGYTSNVLRTEFPELKSKLPTLWTRSYYAESVGSLSQEAIEKYIQNQKNV